MKKLLMVLVLVAIPLSLWSQDKDYYSKEILGDSASNSDTARIQSRHVEIPPHLLRWAILNSDTLDRVQRTDSAWLRYKVEWREWEAKRELSQYNNRILPTYNKSVWPTQMWETMSSQEWQLWMLNRKLDQLSDQIEMMNMRSRRSIFDGWDEAQRQHDLEDQLRNIQRKLDESQFEK